MLEQKLDVLVGARQCDRMGLVGGTISKWLVVKEVHDFLTASSHGEWDGSRRDALSGSDDVRNDSFVVLETKHFSSTTKANHDFIAVHENTVFVAQSTNSLHVSRRHDQHTTSTNNRLQHDGSNVLWSFVEDLLLQHSQSTVNLFGLVVTSVVEKERERIEGLDKAWHFIGTIPATKVSRSGPSSTGSSMVGSVPTNHLLLTRESPRHHNASLIGLRTRRWKDSSSQITRKNLCHELIDPCPHFGNTNPTVDKGQLTHLIGSRFHDGLGYIVTEVGTDCLGRPVEVPLASGIE
mmetsp:Transcript_23890/g.39501  ORF Transcript_23890/g.39501 Transcript_23890/m.39501 type:complete len:293 (-) Transcript_23890:319-1197(-)